MSSTFLLCPECRHKRPGREQKRTEGRETFSEKDDKNQIRGKTEAEYALNEAKIVEEEKYDGYYAVATNLLPVLGADQGSIPHLLYSPAGLPIAGGQV